jgi:hypothetical protein
MRSKARGEEIKRVERKVKDLTPDIEVHDYQNVLSKKYGGSANLTAEKYVKL